MNNNGWQYKAERIETTKCDFPASAGDVLTMERVSGEDPLTYSNTGQGKCFPGDTWCMQMCIRITALKRGQESKNPVCLAQKGRYAQSYFGMV
jgi:hypothetical protein